MQETLAQSLGQEDPLEEEMATHSSILLGNLIDRGAWLATVHGVAELDTTEHSYMHTHIYVCMYTKAQGCKWAVQCHQKFIKES